ncbi:macrolide 2'-phosphotransferase [Oceanobacillus damuensis]|uniref:macrolide 2'-phosphotransferase n=1 Tax=Oceanobacillus damuensis TaxID=937928 RepID=UPI0008358725|nr:macrolide 2'-phosphotransferase [Oceanobacillus damuensis]
MSLSRDQVIDIARNHGLGINLDSLQYNDSGLDFQVVFATDAAGVHWVLRFPRRKDVVRSARKEKRVLDLVGPKLPIEVPKWSIFSDELIAYKLLTGIPAGTIDPEKKAYVWEMDAKNVPDDYHSTLGEALAKLHQINHIEARSAELNVQTPEEIKRSMIVRMEKVKAEFGVSGELWERWQKWVSSEDLWPKQTVFVHGDLHPGHILIDEAARVTGFIDWTEAKVDDPANDFAAHYMAFGDHALKQLIDAYGRSGGYIWTNMFEHIVELTAAYPVAIAEFAMKSDREDMKWMAKQSLGLLD